MVDSGQSGTTSLRGGEECVQLSPEYTAWLPNVEYIPTADDPIITVNVNLIFIARLDGTGSFINIPEHVTLWNDIETSLNTKMSNLTEPSYTGENADCMDPYASFESDSKIRYNLNPVFLNSDTYNDMSQCSSSSIGLALQNYLDANVPELRCSNSINVVMPTDYNNLLDVQTNDATPQYCGEANAMLASYYNLERVSYCHFPNLYTKYWWMKNVIPGTEAGSYYNWDPVIRFWFTDGMAGGLAHELGHNLGLHHDNALHGLNECENSIMHQAPGPRNYLPPSEVGKMHRALAHSNIRNAADLTSYSTTPISITSDTEWDTNRKLYRSVVVEEGATLTVTCRLLFHPDASIIVKQGGTLIVDGGTLTNYCDEMWQGIQVWGDSDKHQYSHSGGQYYQGRAIFINDALLENAWEGIQNWNPGHFDQIGGVIQAEESTFKNCRRAVSFYTYQNTSPTNSNYLRADRSFFKLCTFENNDDYLRDQNVSPPFAMVTLWKTDRVLFSGCKFENSATVNTSESLTKAIYSSDANYIVKEHCSDPFLSTSGCQGVETYSEFIGWHKAIEATGAVSSNRPISVSKSIFKENMIGIEIAGAEYSKIYLNEFEVGNHPNTITDLDQWKTQLGVFSKSTLNFIIDENEFEKPISAPFDGRGVLVYDSKGSENVIYKNDFKNLKVAANGWQVNKNINFEGGVPAGQSGLQFLCNTNQGNEVDFEISRTGTSFDEDYLNAGIRQNQGSDNPQRPAGNTFSAGTADPNVYTHFTVNSLDIYGYFYKTNPPSLSEITPNKVAIQPQLTVSESCPSNYYSGLSEDPGRTQLVGKIAEFNALQYTYKQTIDNGNTEGMVTEIELSWPSDAWNLRDELIARSPFNSAEVLISAAIREIMPHAMLLEVLLENPDALRSGEVIRKVENELANPMPQYMIDLLWASRDQTTLRTSMESALSELHFDVLKMQKRIIQNLAFQDSTSSSNDSIIYFMSKVKTVEGNYERAAAYADGGNFSASIALLDSMLNNYKLATSSVDECNSLKSFYSILDGAPGSEANLDATSIASIKAIAESETAGIAKMRAQNLLCFHYQICYDSNGNRKSSPKTEKPKLSREELLENVNTSNAYPNPASDYVTISYSLLTVRENATLLIFDGFGRQIESKSLGQTYQGQELVDTRKLSDGVYFYQIVQNNEKVVDGKFVITH